MKSIINQSFLKILLCIIGWVTIISCRKFIEVDPPVTRVTEASAYATDASAIGVMTSVYTKISYASSGSIGFSTMSGSIVGLSSDEFTLWSGITNTDMLETYTNSLSSANGSGAQIWYDCYQYLYTCNSAIEGLSETETLTARVKKQLLGEAKFMRAYFNFYLVNYFGDVPLILTSDYRTNASLARTSKTQIYDQIIKDLQDAEDNLSDVFLDGTLVRNTSERVRPTKWAAAALLARVYLYTSKWSEAESQASNVINQTTVFNLASLNSAFIKNGYEAIWQLQPVNSGWNTELARLFIMPSSGPSSTNPVYLSNNLINSFESGDQRRFGGIWIDSVKVGSTFYYYPAKYKGLAVATNASPTEYTMILRLGEQYLIRAEARAQQNNLSDAAKDLNKIRNRGGLADASASTKTEMLKAISKERRAELFSEWGDRWFDLIRTGSVDSVMTVATAQKGGTWNSKQQVFPIPRNEISKNSNLTQNDGY